MLEVFLLTFNFKKVRTLDSCLTPSVFYLFWLYVLGIVLGRKEDGNGEEDQD